MFKSRELLRTSTCLARRHVAKQLRSSLNIRVFYRPGPVPSPSRPSRSVPSSDPLQSPPDRLDQEPRFSTPQQDIQEDNDETQQERSHRDERSTPRAPNQVDQERDDYQQSRTAETRFRTGMVVALGITAVNGYVWYQWELSKSALRRGDGRLALFMANNFLCSKQNWREERYWTVLTSGFSHMAGWHLLANSVGIITFFPAAASRIGVLRVTLLYLASIGGGSAAWLYSSGITKDPVKKRMTGFFSRRQEDNGYGNDPPGLGASGGVCGLFTLSTILAPSAGVALFFIPMPSWFAWGLLTGFDSYFALSEDGRKKLIEKVGFAIGHEAHLGGTAVAVLLLILSPRFRGRGMMRLR